MLDKKEVKSEHTPYNVTQKPLSESYYRKANEHNNLLNKRPISMRSMNSNISAIKRDPSVPVHQPNDDMPAESERDNNQAVKQNKQMSFKIPIELAVPGEIHTYKIDSP